MKGKRYLSKWLTLIGMLAFFIIFWDRGIYANATQTKTENFSYRYSEIGYAPSKDMAYIAKRQQYFTKEKLGYTEDWGADFVTDCAILAGASKAVPKEGNVNTLKAKVLQAGGTQVNSPTEGDLIFYLNKEKNTYDHVGIMLNSTQSILADTRGLFSYDEKVCLLYDARDYGDSYIFIRPKYESTPSMHVDFNKETLTGVVIIRSNSDTKIQKTGIETVNSKGKVISSGEFDNDSCYDCGNYDLNFCPIDGYDTYTVTWWAIIGGKRYESKVTFDTTPQITDAKIENITNKSFDIICNVSKNSKWLDCMYVSVHLEDGISENDYFSQKVPVSSNGKWTYHIDLSQLNMDPGLYNVELNGIGKGWYATSKNILTTKVNIAGTVQAPVITKQPEDVTSSWGEDVTLNVAANNASYYEWYFNTGETPGTTSWKLLTAKDVQGYNTNKISFKLNDKKWINAQFKCYVRNKERRFTVSNTIKVSYKPKITSHPKSITLKPETTGTLTAGAIGLNISYEWQCQLPGYSTWSTLYDGNGSTYSRIFDIADNGIKIRCMISDEYNNTLYTNTATITVNEDLIIKKQPKDANVKTGATAKFTTAASGYKVKYVWQVMEPGSSSWETWSWKTTATLSSVFSNGTRVRCRVTDSLGHELFTNAATVYIYDGPKITLQPKNVNPKSGEKVTFKVKATGKGIKYKWQSQKTNQSKSAKWIDISGATGATYKMTAKNSQNDTKIRCLITDKFGNKLASKAVTIKIYQGPKITKQPKSINSNVNKKVSITVNASGKKLKYQWQYKKAGSNTWKNLKESTKSTLSKKLPKSWNGMKLRCAITDSYGKKIYSKAVKVTVKNK